MRNRNIKINVFLNEDENKILNEKVKKSGLNKSEFFRKIILDYQLKEKPDEKFYEILSQLRGMATNLNQMARTYNKYQGYMREDKINPLLNQIQNFILALEEVYLIPLVEISKKITPLAEEIKHCTNIELRLEKIKQFELHQKKEERKQFEKEQIKKKKDRVR